jgi:hypothetical protein
LNGLFLFAKGKVMSKLNSTSRGQGARRTRIEDIVALGESLPEEHLRLVVGGLRDQCWIQYGSPINGTCTPDIVRDC